MLAISVAVSSATSSLFRPAIWLPTSDLNWVEVRAAICAALMALRLELVRALIWLVLRLAICVLVRAAIAVGASALIWVFVRADICSVVSWEI